jgi:hypothetical protein
MDDKQNEAKRGRSCEDYIFTLNSLAQSLIIFIRIYLFWSKTLSW